MAHVIAVVDDEEDLREALADYLSGHGFRVVTAGDAAGLRALAAVEALDVVILDIAMPGEDGLSLARWLRRNSRAGIIFASASGSPMDRIVGLEIGGDDYLAKPYDLRELLARTRSLIRRLGAAPPPQAPIPQKLHRFGPFTLDATARRLTHEAQGPIDLTAAEYELIEALALRQNRILSRAQLAGLLGTETGGDRSIDVRVTRLRRKIEPDPEAPRFLRTVRGEGYVLTGGEAP